MIGVIPAFLLEREVAHDGLTELRVVGVDAPEQGEDGGPQRRRRRRARRFGTLDELVEMLTWSQLGLHDKPVGLLDVGGYWSDPCWPGSTAPVAEDFLRAGHRALLRTATDVATALDLAAAPAPAGATTDKWVDRR